MTRQVTSAVVTLNLPCDLVIVRPCDSDPDPGPVSRQVACRWDDVRLLLQDMERSFSPSSIHFRIKLLAAAEQLQVRR